MAQKILFVFLSSILCGVCANSWNGSLPDGCLLAISVATNDKLKRDDISVFKVDFSGTVTKLWEFTLNNNDTLNTLGLFAVDAEDELVYLGSRDKFLALDLMTGTVKIKIPLDSMQFFWNYEYVAEDKAVYGVCSGNAQWDWCRIKQTGSNTAHLELFYEMPYTSALSPIDDVYYMDLVEQAIWYYPFHMKGVDEFAVGINYTTGKEIFKSGANPNDTEDVCIVRDRELDRVFTYVVDLDTSAPIGIGELFPHPKQRGMLIDFRDINQYNLNPSFWGTCDYDQTTHTMIGLMSVNENTPTHLLLVDVRSSTYKLTPLPGFQKWSSLSFHSFQYIPRQL